MTHAMAGGGEYDRHSDPQRQDATSLLDLVVDAVDAALDLLLAGWCPR